MPGGRQGNYCIILYPLVICSVAIENGPVEIVDFPIKHGGSFHCYVNVYQRVNPIKPPLNRVNYTLYTIINTSVSGPGSVDLDVRLIFSTEYPIDNILKNKHIPLNCGMFVLFFFGTI